MSAELIVEHKSSSADITEGSVYWKRLRLDSQVSNYLAGARALGVEAREVLYDVIRRPSLRPFLATPEADRKYTKPRKSNPVPRLYKGQREFDETPDEFRERVRADIAENPDTYYRRGTVVRTASELDEAAYDVWTTVEQIDESKRHERWPRNVDACERFHRFCDFWEVCTGETRIDNALRYRQRATAHEELDATSAADDGGGKRRLPLITTTAMKTFRRCAREYFYAYELRYRSLETSEAISFGILMHKGLEVWWSTVDITAALARITQSATSPIQSVLAEELMKGYHARWVDERLDVLAVEQEFVAPLADPRTGEVSERWALGGKIDAIARTETET